VFTAADDLAHLVIEQALRDRFIEFHDGTVPFQDAHGTVHHVPAASFEALYEEIHAEGRLRSPQRWRLQLRRTGKLIYFDGMLDSLLRWARAEGLLRGQRNRQLEPVLKKFRNDVAHGSGHHLVMPVDSARTISDAAEIINHLWGSPTPGGRLYPAPIRRIIQVVAWAPGRTVMSGPAGRPPDPQFADWTCALVRAVPHDEGLMRLDALYESTTYPCDFVWGPGAWKDASAWLEQEQPPEDEVDVLDRLFFVQRHNGRLYLPRSPHVVAGLAEEERHGILVPHPGRLPLRRSLARSRRHLGPVLARHRAMREMPSRVRRSRHLAGDANSCRRHRACRNTTATAPNSSAIGKGMAALL
jgi:hypothetical protein